MQQQQQQQHQQASAYQASCQFWQRRRLRYELLDTIECRRAACYQICVPRCPEDSLAYRMLPPACCCLLLLRLLWRLRLLHVACCWRHQQQQQPQQFVSAVAACLRGRGLGKANAKYGQAMANTAKVRLGALPTWLFFSQILAFSKLVCLFKCIKKTILLLKRQVLNEMKC